MPKLYTKTGDKGLTSLYDMQKLQKKHEVFEALGRIDALSAGIGVLLCEITDEKEILFFRDMQSLLMDLCSLIATWKDRDKLRKITNEHVGNLEVTIDYFDEKNPPLREFILPGGINRAESQAHICRTLARDAERALYTIPLPPEVTIDPEVYQYINRLSDFFFAYGRFLGKGGYLRGKGNSMEHSVKQGWLSWIFRCGRK